MCYASFNTKEKKYRSVILITDGEDHDEEAVSVTKKMAEDGVIVNTIGIGSPQGTLLKLPGTDEYKKDEDGKPVITKLNEEELKDIAKSGNGLYQLMTDADAVASSLQSKLAGIQQSGSVGSALTNYKRYFWIFLLIAFIALVIESVTPETKWIKKASAAFAFFLFISFSSAAQTSNKEIVNGNDAYKKKDYNNAVLSYKKALSKKAKDPVAAFNLGNALYKNDKPDEAAQSYDNAIANANDDLVKQKAYYNKGVTLQKQNKLPECIDAYKKALMLDEKDEDARQNLERALKQQQQQQQKQKDEDKKKEPQTQDDKKKQEEQKQQQQKQPQMSKEDAEEKLKTLEQQEKNLQDKLKKVRASSPQKPKKDW
jgi:tetratricopeptide (TPR) repeat protein